jgi:phage terminase large subunit
VIPTGIVKDLIALRHRYYYDIELMVHELFGFPNEQEQAEGKDIYPWQRTVNNWYNAGERRISVKSGHGVGKTTELVWLIWNHLLTRFPQKTAVTAPTEKQLFNALWAEFKSWGDRLPPELRGLYDITADRCEFMPARADSFVSIATARADQPEALAGVHRNDGSVLLIVDEASGVAEKVYETGQGSMSGPNALTILTGNPVRGQGYFFDTHGKNADIWKTLTVSCLDLPKSGVVDDYVMQVERSYGRDSNVFRVRVLGEFPVRDDDTVVPFEVVEPALTRDIILPKTAPVVWGVDPARFGSDRSALAKRQTKQLLGPIKWWMKLDTMELAARVKLEYDNEPMWLRPAEINVDVIGLGAGVVDRLRQLGLPARGINVSESPSTNADKYANLRAELWFRMSEWFKQRDVKLPESYLRPGSSADDLVGEITAVRYKFRPASGKLAVESKDEMRKRGMRSPDLADALMLTFASDAITLAQGSFASTNWNKKISSPLRRIV